MIVTSTQIIIDSPQLVELFQKKQNPKFLRACEDVLLLMGEIPETVDSLPEDRILVRLNQLSDEIIQSMPHAKLNLHEVVSEVKNSAAVLAQKMDSGAQKRSMNTAKGKEGESIVFDILRTRFNHHDGYTVMNTSGADSCSDFVIKKKTFTDVRVEAKNYSKTIPRSEIDKFTKELVALNDHGVMVSVNPSTDIATKSSIDMDMIPVTNKLVFYLTGTEHLTDVIQLIYKLDGISRATSPGDETSLNLTRDSILKIRALLNDFSNKKSEIRLHLNHSLKLLDDMTFDAIQSIISVEEGHSTKMNCLTCDKAFTSKVLFEKHLASGTCKKRIHSSVF
jgi:hypothetical protein